MHARSLALSLSSFHPPSDTASRLGTCGHFRSKPLDGRVFSTSQINKHIFSWKIMLWHVMKILHLSKDRKKVAMLGTAEKFCLLHNTTLNSYGWGPLHQTWQWSLYSFFINIKRTNLMFHRYNPKNIMILPSFLLFFFSFTLWDNTFLIYFKSQA